MIKSELLYEKVMLRLDMTRETGEEELQEIILAVIEEAAEEEFLPLSEKIRISGNCLMRSDVWISCRI